MKFAGLTDSLAAATSPPQKCRVCGSSSRIAYGLCLGCLLHDTVSNEDAEGTGLAAALQEIEVADTPWRLGNYEIMEEIGRGGMGIIYRARQRHSRRIVALKRVLGYHANSRETLTRFRREAEAAASLDHPNILPIYEVGESDGAPFFSMKFASGGSLQEVGPALRKEPRECVRLLARVARAVHYAHQQGILHRDLKPGNILIDSRGEPLVSDFGLAKWLDASSDLTRTLTVFGTPGFIAPEQAQGRAAKNPQPAADVYSLGAILFNLLAGRPPFLGEHALAVIHQAAETSAPKLRSLVPTADRDLEIICARCLEREPEARYQSAGGLAEDLERWLDGRPIVARPVLLPVRIWRWSKRNPVLAGTAATVVALLLFTCGLFSWHRHTQAQADAEIAKLRQGVMDFAQMQAQVCQPGEKPMLGDVYAVLARQLGVDVNLLRGKLPPFAAALIRSPTASAYERANAAYVAKDYNKAERLGVQAADEARKVSPPNTKVLIQALELAGLSAEAAIQYPRAMQHLREAEKFADVKRN